MTVSVGQLVRVSSYREQPENRIVRIVKVRDTQAEPILYGSAKRKRILRSRFLITVHDIKESLFRSYYDRYLECKPLNWFARLYHRIAEWWVNN